MNAILTCVAAQPLDHPTFSSLITQVTASLGLTSAGDHTATWLEAGKAVDIHLHDKPSPNQIVALRALCHPFKVDVLVTETGNRRKKLLLADMDSTVVVGETLDDLAAHVGIGEQVAAITARAMNGELDFEQALSQRVALLADMSTDVINAVLAEVRLMPGAETLVKTMKAHGAYCILISGGFTCFTHAVAEQCGFDQHVGNTLEIWENRLTGRVMPPVVDKHTKLKVLQSTLTDKRLTAEAALTVGDGANDLPMLLAAGLGVGFQPKPVVLQSVENAVIHGDLTALLYAQGYMLADWA